MSVGIYTLIKNAIEKAKIDTEVISAEKIITMVRGIKTEEEIAKIRKAVIETEKIFKRNGE